MHSIAIVVLSPTSEKPRMPSGMPLQSFYPTIVQLSTGDVLRNGKVTHKDCDLINDAVFTLKKPASRLKSGFSNKFNSLKDLFI